MNHSRGNYQKVDIETTDSLQLVVMLYEGAINFLEQAKLRVAENQPGEKGILIDKVIAIVSELQGSLNVTRGGDVARALDGLYTYIISRLLEANSNNDPNSIDEILGHLRTLKEAWRGAAAVPRAVQRPTAELAPETGAPEEGIAGGTPAVELIG